MPITLASHTAEDGTRTRVPPLVIAHRGASAQWPENTIPAFQAGIDQGADMIEIDVHLCADGVPIVIHDPTLERTTDIRSCRPEHSSLPVSELTSSEVAALDAGSWKGPQFAGLQVPTLVEVLELVHAGRAGLLLEVKDPSRYPGMMEALVDAFAAVGGYLDRCLAAGLLVVQSGDWDFIRRFHDRVPEIPVGLLGRPAGEELNQFASWVDQINPQHSEADTEFLAQVHELGMSSLLWTVDSAADMEAAIDMGADGIITNVPDRLVAVVDGL